MILKKKVVDRELVVSYIGDGTKPLPGDLEAAELSLFPLSYVEYDASGDPNNFDFSMSDNRHATVNGVFPAYINCSISDTIACLNIQRYVGGNYSYWPIANKEESVTIRIQIETEPYISDDGNFMIEYKPIYAPEEAITEEDIETTPRAIVIESKSRSVTLKPILRSEDVLTAGTIHTIIKSKSAEDAGIPTRETIGYNCILVDICKTPYIYLENVSQYDDPTLMMHGDSSIMGCILCEFAAVIGMPWVYDLAPAALLQDTGYTNKLVTSNKALTGNEGDSVHYLEQYVDNELNVITAYYPTVKDADEIKSVKIEYLDDRILAEATLFELDTDNAEVDLSTVFTTEKGNACTFIVLNPKAQIIDGTILVYDTSNESIDNFGVFGGLNFVPILVSAEGCAHQIAIAIFQHEL